MGELMEELSTWKKERPVTIEKVEYNFDQLKVEALEGALHIGVAPGTAGEPGVSGASGIPGVPGVPGSSDAASASFSPTHRSEWHIKVREQVIRYVDEQIPARIRDLQQEYNFVLGEDYIQEMIDDLKKQLDHRIAYYINHPAVPHEKSDQVRFVYEFTIADIERSIERHFHEIKNKRS